ncbi:peptidylprolyl isomerase [Sphingosinicella ginsenosidimutans]|uniref:Parvulin-like PPIase n=2 Tax=Allosphingosinicella ginsenosidimutans TaxID=1176539 RepID=A0A5C6TVX9_9SPHN|nr:peptidylprolyl isomerase [Sphingosinicella ginsenosidimutans]TXC64396.1 peptidylprolyl isomerase [Sphingosinicella ginsenosidimutans]
MKLGWLPGATALIAASLMSAGVAAQSGESAAASAPQAATPAPTPPPAAAAQPAEAATTEDTSGLNIPADVTFIGNREPDVRKATAIVNGQVITETDINQRLALFLASNRIQLPPDQVQAARAQVLRNLIDETIEIQAAAQDEITIQQSELDQYYERFAQSFNKTPAEMSEYLRSINSSERSMKRQILGELAWQRLQQRRINPFVDVGDDEVQAVLARLQASRGTTEYHVAEIFLTATPETSNEVEANANRIIQQLRAGASFQAYARQFSEASTAAVGGDLGWVRAEQLPSEISSILPQMPLGAVTNPIAVPGGYSIIALVDKRQIGVADPRDALLSLIQLSITLPAGTSDAQTRERAQALAQATQSMGGCGHAQATAQALGAELVSNDQVQARQLPPALQDMLLNLSIGQATQPFGGAERISVLVLCGRDDPPQSSGPSFDQIYQQLNEQRINNRAQRYLRDLRRDAVIDYR